LPIITAKLLWLLLEMQEGLSLLIPNDFILQNVDSVELLYGLKKFSQEQTLTNQFFCTMEIKIQKI